MTKDRDPRDPSLFDPNSLQLEEIGRRDVPSLQLEPLGGGEEEPAGPGEEVPSLPSTDSIELAPVEEEARPRTTAPLPSEPPAPVEKGPAPPVEDEPPPRDLAEEVRKATSTLDVDTTEDPEEIGTEAVIAVRRSFWETTAGVLVVTLVVSFVFGALVALYYIRNLYPEPIVPGHLLGPTMRTFLVWTVSGALVSPLIWYGYGRLVE